MSTSQVQEGWVLGSDLSWAFHLTLAMCPGSMLTYFLCTSTPSTLWGQDTSFTFLYPQLLMKRHPSKGELVEGEEFISHSSLPAHPFPTCQTASVWQGELPWQGQWPRNSQAGFKAPSTPIFDLNSQCGQEPNRPIAKICTWKGSSSCIVFMFGTGSRSFAAQGRCPWGAGPPRCCECHVARLEGDFLPQGPRLQPSSVRTATGDLRFLDGASDKNHSCPLEGNVSLLHLAHACNFF